MICGEARELIGGDPETDTPELLAHLDACPECQVYRAQMLALNAKIRRALELDPQKLQPPGTTSAPMTSATSRASTTAMAGPTAPPTAARTADAPGPAFGPSTPMASAPRAPTTATSDPTAPARSRAPAPPTNAPRTASAASTPMASAPRAPTAATSDPTAPAASRAAASPAGQQPAAPPPPARSNVSALPRRAPTPVPKHKRPRLFAFAASLAAALVAGFTLWLSRPAESLAAEIVAHVEGEPNSWAKTQPVTADHLESVLRKSGVKLGSGMQPVVYASSCWFRGHFVPHFVVTTKDGPVTVMILSNEHVSASQQFKEDGYTGLLVPVRSGSVAVISRTPMVLEQPASEVVTALQAAN